MTLNNTKKNIEIQTFLIEKGHINLSLKERTHKPFL